MDALQQIMALAQSAEQFAKAHATLQPTIAPNAMGEQLFAASLNCGAAANRILVGMLAPPEAIAPTKPPAAARLTRK